jgi:hypothetical protein
MKKAFSLVLALTLLLVPLCIRAEAAGPSADELAGTYYLFSLEYAGQEMQPSEMNMSASIELRKDGTASLEMNGNASALPKWTVEEDSVTLWNDAGDPLECAFQDGVITLDMGGGYFMFFSRDGAAPDSRLYKLYKEIDANAGSHLSYEFHSDYLDSTSVFDVHARDGKYFSKRVTKAKGLEQMNATCFLDGTAYVLYPDELRGNVATTTSSGIIKNNVLMMDDLYKAVYARAQRTDFSVETRELDGKTFTVEVFPATAYKEEAAFYFDEAGQLIHVTEAAPKLAPEMGETFYTVHKIDTAVDDSLFDLCAYTISQ